MAPVEGERTRERERKRKCCPQRRSRKGKGGPENPSCTFRGVRQRTWGKWVAEIRKPNRGPRLWLGTFSTSLDAARAYDRAARSLYGDSTTFNLPRKPPAALSEGPEGSRLPSCSSSPPRSLSTVTTGCGVSRSEAAASVAGRAGLVDLDEYVMRLPKAEDFGLDAFHEIHMGGDVAGMGGLELEGGFVNL